MVHLIFRRIFFDILQMSTDWQDYTSNRYSSRIMTDTANVAHRTSRWIVGTQVVAVFLYSAGVFAANANGPESLQPYAREFILKMELPFNISTNFIYMTVQTVQIYHLLLLHNLSGTIFQPKNSNYTVPYSEITKKIDDHEWKNRRPFLGAIYQCKI